MNEGRSKPRARLLITDLDNTLWDWFQAWYRSFSAMLNKLSELSGVSVQQLEREIQVVHRARGTTEYSYLLNELPSLLRQGLDSDPLTYYDQAIHTLNRERRTFTNLYPGVKDTLIKLRQRGIPVVGYSESIAYWTEWRIRKTRLDGLLSVLYTSPDHDLPSGVTFEKLRWHPNHEYGLVQTEHRHVPEGTLKPAPSILKKIMCDFDVEPSQAVYVGDSLMKDVAMAQMVGALDVHASYGIAQHAEGYDLLRRVSHWSQGEIEREKQLASQPDVTPTYSLRSGFNELLETFDLGGNC
ncbi:HAD family hydrolase [Amycolatopsis acidiphila]|uniref:HAD family hydrolase n=1 Tax=Amycolatopsis acidiphila TaxID=715473 RepID=A0A558AGV5_9PSEU|nr:HAD family hydrolase [Amycolatopsis acidiphila]TVT23441.1 HAD family hydrolase [Amycolatopsis acidiphila]UIJ59891.1 HAD family hydrolase [Amycolatopsis acidiphila]GHG62619.1 hypothetical protein GCM10017788_18310 [Amycolatopsis acidiphila]